MIVSNHAFVDLLSVAYFVKPYRIYFILTISKGIQWIRRICCKTQTMPNIATKTPVYAIHPAV